jgi:hypothetical protein
MKKGELFMYLEEKLDRLIEKQKELLNLVEIFLQDLTTALFPHSNFKKR